MVLSPAMCPDELPVGRLIAERPIRYCLTVSLELPGISGHPDPFHTVLINDCHRSVSSD